MAAVIKAANAKIRANPAMNYIFSTHFLGPISTFGIPIAAIIDTQKSPDVISGQMTLALCAYSSTFLRFSMVIHPKNYLLFACHSLNLGAQLTQGYRYVNRHYLGGSSGNIAEDAVEAVKEDAQVAENKVKDLVSK